MTALCLAEARALCLGSAEFWANAVVARRNGRKSWERMVRALLGFEDGAGFVGGGAHGGEVVVEGVAVGFEAAAVCVDVDGIVVGAGAHGGVVAGAVADFHIAGFVEGDDDEVGVFLERDFEGLVEFDDAVLEHLGVGGTGEVEVGMGAAVDEELDAIDVDPVGALDADFEVDGAGGADVIAGDFAVGGGDFEEGSGGEDDVAGFGAGGEFGPIDFGGVIGAGGEVGAPAADAVAVDAMGIGNADGDDAVALIEELFPDELADGAGFGGEGAGFAGDAEGSVMEDVGAGAILGLAAVDHGADADETTVCDAVAIAVDEHVGEVGVIELDPAVGAFTLPAAEGEGGDAGVVIPDGSAAVLEEGVGFEGEGVEVLAAPGEFDAFDRFDEGSETECVDGGLPVVEAVVLGGGGEFEVFGGDVDEAAVGVADVVATGGAVIVEVAADPAGGVDKAFKGALDGGLLAGGEGDFLSEVTVFGAADDDDAVFAGGELDGELADFAVVLVDAAVGAVFGAEVEFGGAGVEGFEVGFAGEGFAGFVGDVEADEGGGCEAEGGFSGLAGGDGKVGFDFVATDVGGGEFVLAGGEAELEAAFGVGVGEDGGGTDFDGDGAGGEGLIFFVGEEAVDLADGFAFGCEGFADGLGGRGADGEKAGDDDFLFGGEFEGVGEIVGAGEACGGEGVAALVGGVDGVIPGDAADGGAVGFEAGEVGFGGGLEGFVSVVAEGGGDEEALEAVFGAVFVAFVEAAVGGGGGDALDGGFGGVLGGEDADEGDGAVAAGGVGDKLVVGGAAQGEVVEAAGADAVGAVEGAHVGAAVGLVAGDDGLDAVIAEDEVTADAVSFFALREFGFATEIGFEDFGCWDG